MKDEFRYPNGKTGVWGRAVTFGIAHAFDADKATFAIPQTSVCGKAHVQTVFTDNIKEKCQECLAKTLVALLAGHT